MPRGRKSSQAPGVPHAGPSNTKADNGRDTARLDQERERLIAERKSELGLVMGRHEDLVCSASDTSTELSCSLFAFLASRAVPSASVRVLALFQPRCMFQAFLTSFLCTSLEVVTPISHCSLLRRANMPRRFRNMRLSVTRASWNVSHFASILF